MKFDIKKVIQPLPLREYAEGYPEGLAVQVWVNPPRSLLQQRDELDRELGRMAAVAYKDEEARLQAIAKESDPQRIKELQSADEQAVQAYREEIKAYTGRSYEWFSQLWSQGPAETHWPLEDLHELSEHDPALLMWMLERTRELLRAHREHEKKG